MEGGQVEGRPIWRQNRVRLSAEEVLPFVGAIVGIKSIKDCEGNVIYSNEGVVL